MGGDYFFPLLTFAAGFFLLLGWLYVTAANSRSTTLLLKSVGYFVLPGIVLVELPRFALTFPLASLFWPLVEELLKSAAALTERKPTDRFWLVFLFGVWELMLAKSIWGVSHARLLQNWTEAGLFGLAAAALLAVLMHGVTAEIYAFRFRGRFPAAIAVSWAIHTSFNKSFDVLGLSLFTAAVLFIVLLIVIIALWPRPGLVASLG